MTKKTKQELREEVIMGGRDFGISMVLYRHAVGEILGVNVTDMECLALIYFKGLATPSEISRYTGLTTGATTTMLDRLEKAQLIERKANPKDRRGVLIIASQKRNKEVGALFVNLRDAVNTMTEKYSEKELATIAEYLQNVTSLWEEERKKLVEKKSSFLRRQESRRNGSRIKSGMTK